MSKWKKIYCIASIVSLAIAIAIGCALFFGDTAYATEYAFRNKP